MARDGAEGAGPVAAVSGPDADQLTRLLERGAVTVSVDIQTEITRQIVTAVRGEMSEEEAQNLAQLPTENLAAYEAYEQAWAIIRRPD